jgi:hypothetical protein
MDRKRKDMRKATAGNGLFGAMAAASPQTVQCNFGSSYPAASSVEAATAPSRLDVGSNGREPVYHKFEVLNNFEKS